MSSEISISPKASADIIEIWNYTARTHSEDAADSYIRAIDGTMAMALQFPEIGSDYSEIRQGYRKLRSGSHLIFYLPTESGINIIRILHQRVDCLTQLHE